MFQLNTARLILDRVTGDDLQRAFEQRSPQQLREWLGDEGVYQRNLRRFEAGHFVGMNTVVQFHLHLKNTSETIGACGFHNWQPEHQRAEIGYAHYREEFKHQGYMKEALVAVLNYGFHGMNLHRIDSLVSDSNTPSLKLMRHFGFTQEGALREHYLRDGIFESSLMFGLLKHEWISRP